MLACPKISFRIPLHQLFTKRLKDTFIFGIGIFISFLSIEKYENLKAQISENANRHILPQNVFVTTSANWS